LSNDLLDHIRNGDGYRSLINETRIASVLRGLKWQTAHSAHYTDANEGKEREIDVVARSSWVRGRHDQIAHLHLFVECKSLASKQILLADLTGEAGGAEKIYYSWPGEDDDALRTAIRTIVADRGVDSATVMERFDEIAYPDGEASINVVVPQAPKPPFRASAARESSRDSDAGPLWDGIREVFSAMNGATREEISLTLDELRDEIGGVEEPDVEWAVDRLRAAASTVMLYHPVVVVEAPLFRLSASGRMTPAAWGRLNHARVGVSAARWVDVVNAEAFDDYAAAVTAWYERFFTRHKCERV
jgi:hypothetical protein